MKTNNIIKLLGILGFLMAFFSCKTQQKFTTTSPYKNMTAWIQPWAGGRLGSGHGTIVHISVLNNAQIKPDSVFYNGQKDKIQVLSNKTQLELETNLRSFNLKETAISGGVSSPIDTDSIAKNGKIVLSFITKKGTTYYEISKFTKKPLMAYAVAKPQR